ncbi:MAG: histone deacetylase [Caldilineaceae bacterium]|nr:histone deacetylase [Caldilineaceae bacterium]
MPRTAFVYDPFNLRHTRNRHPENYRRLEESWALLQIDGILNNLIRVPSSPAPLDAVLRVHTPEYLERLHSASMLGGGHLDADTYINADSYEAALLAAGGLLNVTDAVMEGRADNGFALVRPPGHHALSFQGMGFCLLANAAIAARWVQDAHGVERVLIVDFDVHHGNGTQDIFIDDPNILFFSAHQFPYYPGSGAAQEIGLEAGEGATVNVPFPPSVGDAGYLESFRRVLAPIAISFKPEVILLSAGFDAHWMDPLASMSLSITGYAQLLRALMEVADAVCHGRLVCTLEGGYHLEVLAHCVLTSLRILSGSPRGVSDPFGPAPENERDVRVLLDRIKNLHGIHEPPHYSIP